MDPLPSILNQRERVQSNVYNIIGLLSRKIPEFLRSKICNESHLDAVRERCRGGEVLRDTNDSLLESSAKGCSKMISSPVWFN